MFTNVKLATKLERVTPAMGLAVRQPISPNSNRRNQGFAGGYACAPPQPFQPPGADPHAGWCGRGAAYNGRPLCRSWGLYGD